MNIRNRWFLLFAGLLSVVLTFGAACGDDDDDGDGGGATPAATSATGGQAPADQQKITIQSVEPELYDPHRSNFEQDIGVERMLFRGLYNLVDDGEGGVEVVPMMAASDPVIDGNTYTITLKSGLKWSDGEPLTAADFVYGWRRGCDPTVAATYGYLLGEGFLDVAGCNESLTNEDAAQQQALLAAVAVSATDDTTFVVELNQPNGRFTTIAALWVTFPARQDVIEEFGQAWTDPGNIVTNGPYTLSQVIPGDRAVLVPNENWTAGQTPAIQEITIRFYDDFSAAFRAFQTDELDMTRIQETDVVTVADDPQLILLQSSRIDAIHMNLADPTLAEPNVRLALARAIDRETLNEVIYDGVSTPATYWIVRGLTGFQGNEPFDPIIGFDEAAAQQALSDAGYPGGQGFPTLSIVMRDDPVQRNLFDFLQQGWQDVLGITVEAEFVDGPTRSSRFNTEDFQLFRGGWQTDYPDIENPLLGLFNTGGGNNHYNCSDTDIDAAFDEAIAATTEEARIAAYQEVETLVVTKLCGTTPITQLAQPFMVRSTIGGVTANGVIDAGMAGNACVECWFVKAE
ncbi:MAG: peptide ABC transporter substrate-binding protein [Dehalococcoidia bacterium]